MRRFGALIIFSASQELDKMRETSALGAATPFLKNLMFGLLLADAVFSRKITSRDQASPSPPMLNFLAVGDIGLAGEIQTRIAIAMDQWAQEKNAQFTVNLGDNFYENGVSSKDDPLWDSAWRKIFTAPSLNHTWYSVLGNHDYRQNPQAQVCGCFF